MKTGDCAALRSLLEQDPELARARAANGASAILLAIYHGHPQLVRVFLQAGAELDFFEACAAGDRERAAELLDQDPPLVSRLSADGYPALGLAVFFGHPEIAEMLLERGADPNLAASNAQKVAPLHSAVARRDARMVARLLAAGADPNAVQAAGFTALHGSAFQADLETARLLIAHGSDPGAKSSDGKTAAQIAHERGHHAFADWLASAA